MVATSDGFKIAEVDLKLRGPGNIMGTQQSGVLQFKIADYIKDQPIMRLARNTAYQLLQKDANLSLPENKLIQNTLQEIRKNVGDWSYIS